MKAKKKMLNAYPRIISNLGQMSSNDPVSTLYRKMVTYMNHYALSLFDREQIIEAFLHGNRDGQIQPAVATDPFFEDGSLRRRLHSSPTCLNKRQWDTPIR